MDSAAVERVLQRVAEDGTVENEQVLSDDAIEIGRTSTDFACPDDSEMAARHAQVRVQGGTAVVSDSGEGSGVWLRVIGSKGRILDLGDQVWLGAQILLIRREQESWQLHHHGSDGRFLEKYVVPAAGFLIGRASDLVLDPNDFRLSRRHAQIMPEGDGLRLYDRGAHNGTYVKLVAAEPLSDGDEFRLANSRFRYLTREVSRSTEAEVEEAEPPDQTIIAIAAAPETSPAPESQPDEQPRRGGLAARLRSQRRNSSEKEQEPVSPFVPAEEATVLSFDLSTEKVLLVIDSDAGSVSLEVSPGKTVLEAVQEAGLSRGEPVDWECGDGGCGVCVMGVVEGASRMDPPDPASGEMKTIQITEQVVPDPTKYRLACLARLRGSVRLRKLS